MFKKINFMSLFNKIKSNLINKNLFEIVIKLFEKIYIFELISKFLIKFNDIADYKNENFKSLIIDSTYYLSDLCILGKKFRTDKSPYNTIGHRHSYTAIYNFLFSSKRNEKINLAEIGILNNSSIKMWRNYFPKAKIYGFDYDKKLINIAKKHKLRATKYDHINANSISSINSTFKKTNTKFDIIIDDSTHYFEAQINIILNCKKFLKKNGIMIIEDIYTHKNQYLEKNYYKKLKHISSEFADIFFITCKHKNNFSGLWLNHKLLILKK